MGCLTPELGPPLEYGVMNGVSRMRIRSGDSFRIDLDAVVILDVFAKKTSQTPKRVIDACKRRLRQYDDI